MFHGDCLLFLVVWTHSSKGTCRSAQPFCSWGLEELGGSQVTCAEESNEDSFGCASQLCFGVGPAEPKPRCLSWFGRTGLVLLGLMLREQQGIASGTCTGVCPGAIQHHAQQGAAVPAAWPVLGKPLEVAAVERPVMTISAPVLLQSFLRNTLPISLTKSTQLVSKQMRRTKKATATAAGSTIAALLCGGTGFLLYYKDTTLACQLGNLQL